MLRIHAINDFNKFSDRNYFSMLTLKLCVTKNGDPISIELLEGRLVYPRFLQRQNIFRAN